MISSRSNAAVKAIRALRNRRAREDSHLFFAEGIRLAIEAIDRGIEIETVVVAPDLLHSAAAEHAIARMTSAGARPLEVTTDVFRTLSEKDGPMGIAVVGKQRWESLADIDPSHDLQWIALESLQDPGNLGTILRSCDGAGGAGAIILGDSTDPYDPASLRAAMGATFSQRLVRSTFQELRAWCSEHGVQLVGTSDRSGDQYRIVKYRPPVCILMGSERQGLDENHISGCDVMARIPMGGRSDSLNVAVAASLMLYEVLAGTTSVADTRT